jgi:hypothetical protein
MANSPNKIKFFIGTPSEVEREFNNWILAGGFYYSSVNMAGTADKVVLSVVYRMQEHYMYY